MTVAATAASLAAPSGTGSPTMSASETPMPPGTGTTPWNRLVATTTTTQGIRPSGEPTAYNAAQRMSPHISWAKADHADLTTGTTRSRSLVILHNVTSTTTRTSSTTQSTARQSAPLREVAARSTDTAPVPNATRRIASWAMKPDRPSMPPWVTASMGETPYLHKKAAFIVTRPATPGTAKEMNAMALCRMVTGSRGSDRPTENIMDAAWGRNATWPRATAQTTTHQIASCSSTHSWA